MTIVHVIARLNVGGAALHVLQLAARAARRGHDVVVVAGTLAAGEESMEYVADELGVAVLRLPALQRELSLRADAAAIRALRRIIRRAAPGRPPHAHGQGRRHRPARRPALGSRAAAGDRPHLPRPRPQRLLQPGAASGSSARSSGARAHVTGDADRRQRRGARRSRRASASRRPSRFVVVPYGFDLSGVERGRRRGAEPRARRARRRRRRRSSSAGPAG